MTTEQINKLYCKYEARLGASMTKTLGNSFINLYVMGVSKFFKVVNPPILIQDLEEDPFINNALTNTCCELYYRYGMYLAPFTAILTTARHIEPLASLDFRKKDENNDIKMMNENPEQKRKQRRKKKKEVFKNPNQKDPKRVAAGKKGAEVRIRNAELRKKEVEKLKKENSKIKQITKDSDTETDYESNEHIPSVKKHSSS
ncbi:unnamed protein product [Mytilus coruscus]|uniref:Uncharacterized protein n=1 Tax=Mytilus coruscus TaxID=42192 RepID=A0A6J8AA81_MYTCO|nr:unnamed protein product [Mytilus coruscus]